MAETRRGLSLMLTAAKLAILLSFIAGISGTARVVGEGLRGEPPSAGEMLVWPALGLAPLAGGWVAWKLLRGPDGEGLFAVAAVTAVLGAAVVAVWIGSALAR